jgi:hypothetical protein
MKKKKEGDGPEKFVVRLDETGYFGTRPWNPVPLEKATRMTKKRATLIWNRMTRYEIGYASAEIETLNDNL